MNMTPAQHVASQHLTQDEKHLLRFIDDHARRVRGEMFPEEIGPGYVAALCTLLHYGFMETRTYWDSKAPANTNIKLVITPAGRAIVDPEG